MPWWALLGSIVATETSTATFLSVPGISFNPGGDLRFLQLALGFIVGRCLVAVWLLPSYFRGEILSAYELLEIRFGVAAKRTASLLFLVARTLGDGLRLFLAALALEAAFGISLPLSVAVISGVTVVYTLFGGMRSVVWNDCLQFVVYIAGGLAALAMMVGRLPGGAGQLWEFAVANDKLRWFSGAWDLSDPYTIWAGLIGGACLSLGTHGTDQMMVQRYLAARSQRDAAKALVLSGLVVFVQFVLFLGIGVGLACFFAQFPPRVPIASGDKAFALFIVGQMPAGLVGLTLAAVFAAVMSTLASSLNSSAAVAINDFGPPRTSPATVPAASPLVPGCDGRLWRTPSGRRIGRPVLFAKRRQRRPGDCRLRWWDSAGRLFPGAVRPASGTGGRTGGDAGRRHRRLGGQVRHERGVAVVQRRRVCGYVSNRLAEQLGWVGEAASHERKNERRESGGKSPHSKMLPRLGLGLGSIHVRRGCRCGWTAARAAKVAARGAAAGWHECGPTGGDRSAGRRRNRRR